jgi:ABC-type maltose transport system permease subunit
MILNMHIRFTFMINLYLLLQMLHQQNYNFILAFVGLSRLVPLADKLDKGWFSELACCEDP